MAEVEPVTVPDPVLAGTFAIYETPDGGYVLVTDTNGEVQRRHIPGKMVRLFTTGPFAGRFRGLFAEPEQV